MASIEEDYAEYQRLSITYAYALAIPVALVMIVLSKLTPRLNDLLYAPFQSHPMQEYHSSQEQRSWCATVIMKRRQLIIRSVDTIVFSCIATFMLVEKLLLVVQVGTECSAAESLASEGFDCFAVEFKVGGGSIPRALNCSETVSDPLFQCYRSLPSSDVDYYAVLDALGLAAAVIPLLIFASRAVGLVYLFATNLLACNIRGQVGNPHIRTRQYVAFTLIFIGLLSTSIALVIVFARSGASRETNFTILAFIVQGGIYAFLEILSGENIFKQEPDDIKLKKGNVKLEEDELEKNTVVL